MLTRLATKEWFTARISSAALIASAYSNLTEAQQEEQLNHFSQLCRDDTPMVRRVAAQYLGTMLQNVVKASGRSSLEQPDGTVTKMLIPLYEELASNEQPVRTVDNFVPYYARCRTMQMLILENIADHRF